MSQNSTRITYHQRLGISPEEACNARTRCWAFIFDCFAKQEVAHPGDPDDAERISNEIRAKDIISQ